MRILQFQISNQLFCVSCVRSHQFFFFWRLDVEFDDVTWILINNLFVLLGSICIHRARVFFLLFIYVHAKKDQQTNAFYDVNILAYCAMCVIADYLMSFFIRIANLITTDAITIQQELVSWWWQTKIIAE